MKNYGYLGNMRKDVVVKHMRTNISVGNSIITLKKKTNPEKRKWRNRKTKRSKNIFRKKW